MKSIIVLPTLYSFVLTLLVKNVDLSSAFLVSPATKSALSSSSSTCSRKTPPLSTRLCSAAPTHSSAPTATSAAIVDAEEQTEEELYKKLGVEEDKLALGITPDEVLEWIGTREDIINKFQADMPRLSRTEAETEVDRFLMDGEMLDLYIKYSQRKAEDPNWEPIYDQQDEGPFAVFMRIVSTYAIWIVGALLLKDVVTGYLNQNSGSGGEEAAADLAASILESSHTHFMV